MMFDKTSGLWARGLEHASDLLIRRGSVMGSLLPTLLLVPLFLTAAWLCQERWFLSMPFGLIAFGIVFNYCRHFDSFARHDPDRLQSEEYRYEMKKIQMIAAKELPYPMSAESLHLPSPMSNPAHPLPPSVAEEEAHHPEFAK